MRFLLLLLPLLLAAGGLWLTMGGLQYSGPPPAPAQELPRYAVTDAQWTRLGPGGQPEFRATAASIDYYADESARMKQLTLDSMGGLKSPWHVKADAGLAPPRERRLQVSGDVSAVGRTVEGNALVFRTEKLWVDLLRHELRTEAPVTVESGFRRASGRGMRADFKGERVELLNNVQVEYAPEPKAGSPAARAPNHAG